jgi:hypothetical protein
MLALLDFNVKRPDCRNYSWDTTLSRWHSWIGRRARQLSAFPKHILDPANQPANLRLTKTIYQ